MSDWKPLYDAHQKVRAVGTDLLDSLRGRLVQLADRHHCQPTIRGRFSYRKLPDRPNSVIEYGISSGREPLARLAELPVATLTLLAKVNSRRTYLHQFTAMIEGITVVGLSWAAAVHLEDDVGAPGGDRKGSGACGHAAFHCHVGPTLDAEPKVRVPFPAVGPAAALDWLLTMVVPDWEPAPW